MSVILYLGLLRGEANSSKKSPASATKSCCSVCLKQVVLVKGRCTCIHLKKIVGGGGGRAVPELFPQANLIHGLSEIA